MMLSILVSIVFSSVVGFLPSAHAYLPNAKTPLCFDRSESIEIDNERVLRMKEEKPNQFKARAFVSGKVITEPKLVGGHERFSIMIGSNTTDTLEMVYNVSPEFGDLPPVRIGDDIVVCGEFINSFKDGGGYKASPDGAIVHWVHYNPGDRDPDHEHGFMMFDGNLAGFDDAAPGAWEGEIEGGGGGNGQSGRKAKKNGSNRSRLDDDRTSRWRPCRSLEECRERNGEF